MHTAPSHIAGGAWGPPQPVQSGPPDCFLLCSLQEGEGVRVQWGQGQGSSHGPNPASHRGKHSGLVAGGPGSDFRLDAGNLCTQPQCSHLRIRASRAWELDISTRLTKMGVPRGKPKGRVRWGWDGTRGPARMGAGGHGPTRGSWRAADLSGKLQFHLSKLHPQLLAHPAPPLTHQQCPETTLSLTPPLPPRSPLPTVPRLLGLF